PNWRGLYRVSDRGRVKSLRPLGLRGRHAKDGILKPIPKDSGYLRVSLCRNGKRTKVPIHYLVLKAFVGHRPLGAQACHCDSDKTNNHLSNLRWDTPQNNHADRTHKKPLKVRAIRDLFATGRYTLEDLSQLFTLRVTTIQNVVSGK